MYCYKNRTPLQHSKVLLHDAHLVRASICWVSWSEQWTDGVTCIYSCDISKGAMKPNCPALVCSLQRISHWWFVVTLRTHRKQHIWVQCNRVLHFPFSFAASWLLPKYAVILVARLQGLAMLLCCLTIKNLACALSLCFYTLLTAFLASCAAVYSHVTAASFFS